jgi:hypothetical protein
MNWREPKAGRRWFHFATLTRADTLAILDDVVRVEQRSLAALKLEQLKTMRPVRLSRAAYSSRSPSTFRVFRLTRCTRVQATHWNDIGVIIVGHLIGGPSLHILAGVGATIKKRPRHPGNGSMVVVPNEKGRQTAP